MIRDQLTEYIVLSGIFCLGAIATRRVQAGWWRSPQAAEVATNTGFFFLDAALIAPAVALLAGTLVQCLPHVAQIPSELPFALQLLIVLFISDLVGYWRHRALHSFSLWPFHAIHHSDQHVHWLTLVRVHPGERLITALADSSVLALIGAEPTLIIANNLLRHYYGYLLHANIGWHGGILRYVIVMPHFHRWHHGNCAEARGKNFAVIFAFIDWAFGTFYCPKDRPPALGIDEIRERTSITRLLPHPFQRRADNGSGL